MFVILGLLVVVVILFGVPLWMMVVYNQLVTLRNLVETAWAQVDVQLRRRHDLIPNVVETVKGYATHERETFEKVIQARNAARDATNPQAKAEAENALTGAIKSVFAVAEAYPELKANQNFLSLQGELTTTEGFIAQCRSEYNDSVLTYNNTLQVFPANTVAGLFKFQHREYFGVPEGGQREPVKVQF
ncbi:MAG: LemA family protein [Verrucomicrobiia bacterium]|jgi:LemA protein